VAQLTADAMQALPTPAYAYQGGVTVPNHAWNLVGPVVNGAGVLNSAYSNSTSGYSPGNVYVSTTLVQIPTNATTLPRIIWSLPNPTSGTIYWDIYITSWSGNLASRRRRMNVEPNPSNVASDLEVLKQQMSEFRSTLSAQRSMMTAPDDFIPIGGMTPEPRSGPVLPERRWVSLSGDLSDVLNRCEGKPICGDPICGVKAGAVGVWYCDKHTKLHGGAFLKKVGTCWMAQL